MLLFMVEINKIQISSFPRKRESVDTTGYFDSRFRGNDNEAKKRGLSLSEAY